MHQMLCQWLESIHRFVDCVFVTLVIKNLALGLHITCKDLYFAVLMLTVRSIPLFLFLCFISRVLQERVYMPKIEKHTPYFLFFQV